MKRKIMSLLMILILVLAISHSMLAKEISIIRAGSGEDSRYLYDLFTEKTGIKVNVNAIPQREMLQALEVLMSGGDASIDLIHVDSPLTASYALREYLLPLDDYFDVDAIEWTEAGIDAGSWNNSLYSAPFETSTQLFYVNLELFQEAGIAPPSMDVDKRWTWEQVVEAGKKIRDQTGKWGFVFEQVNRPYQLLPLPQSLGGGSGVSPSGLEMDGYLNNDAWIEAFQFYHDLFNTWEISPKGMSADETWDQFLSGNIGMIVAGIWQLPSAERSADFEFGLAAHPYFEGGEVVTPTGSWHWGINKNSQNIEEAVQFLDFLTVNREMVKDRFINVGQLVPHEVMFEVIEEDPQYQKFPRSAYQIASYELEHTAAVRPATPAYLEWEDITIRTFEDIRNGADPEEALNDAVRRLNSLMRRYK